MGALLHHVPLVHHQDPVGIADGGEAVGDHEAGLPLHQLAHGPLDFPLGGGVDVAGRLVQDQHRRIVEHRPGDGQKLLLSLGDVSPVLADDGLVALRQAHDEGVDVGGFGGRHHLVHGRPFLSVGDVVENRSPEHPGILQHHGVGAAQAFPGQGADVLPVHRDAAGVHVVKAHQQVDDGGLARPGRPDDGDQLPCVGAHGQVMDDGPAGIVAEGYVFQGHVALDVPELPGVRSVLQLLPLVQQSEHPLRRCQGGKQLVDDVGDLVDRAGELPGIQYKGRNVAQTDRPVHVQEGAQQGDQAQTDVVDEAHRRPDGHAQGIGVVIRIGGIVVDPVVLVVHLVLVGVGQNGLLAGQLLLHKAVHRPVGLGALHEARLGQLAHVGGIGCGGRHCHQRHQRQRRGDADHHEHGAQHRHRAGDDGHHVRRHTGTDHVHVVGGPADDVPRLVAVKKAHGQAHQLVEHVLAHLFRDPLGNVDHHRVNQHRQQGGDHVHRQHPHREIGHLVKIDQALAGSGLVDGAARQPRPHQGQHIADDTHAPHQGDGQLEGAQVGQQAAQGALRVLGLGHNRIPAGQITTPPPSASAGSPGIPGSPAAAPRGCPCRSSPPRPAR